MTDTWARLYGFVTFKELNKMELKFEPFNPVIISKDEKLPIKVRDAISQKEYYLCKVKNLH